MSTSQRDHQFGTWAAAWMKLHPAVDVAFAADALAAELALVDARLGVEVARGGDGEVEVIVTAFSEPALFDTVDRLVQSVEPTAFDSSLNPIAELAVGRALRREGEHGEWREWRTR